MKMILGRLHRLKQDETGAAMVEYTILLGMITVAVIASVVVVSAWITGQWAGLTTALP